MAKTIDLAPALFVAAALVCGGGCLGNVMPPEEPPALGPDPSPSPLGDAPAPPTDPAAPTPPAEAVAIVPPAATMHLLTGAQYRNTVRDLFGSAVKTVPPLEADPLVDGLATLGASSAGISDRGAQLYEAAARQIAQEVFSRPTERTRLVPCVPTGAADEACARRAIELLGARLWRRPLSTDESARFTRVVIETAKALGDFWLGLEHTVAGLLQSPKFLFRVDQDEPDPARPGFRRYTAHTLAARLSYALWNTTPDAALLDAAAKGTLLTDAGLEAQLRRLLASPRLAETLAQHFAERFELATLAEVSKDERVFPAAKSQTLVSSMQEETMRVLRDRLVDGGADLLELADGRTTFVNGELARLYGLPDTGAAFAKVELPANGPRRGLLGHASILARLGDVNRGSITFRGRFVRQKLLCGTIPDPPDDVDTAMPTDPPTRPRTQRQRTAHYRETPGCAACHRLMDPIGFGLEQFDGIGAARDRENGLPVDATGELDGVKFADAVGLAAALRAHPQLLRCTVRTLYHGLHGQAGHAGEEAVIDALTAQLRDGGRTVKHLARVIVLRQTFRTVGAVSERSPR